MRNFDLDKRVGRLFQPPLRLGDVRYSCNILDVSQPSNGHGVITKPIELSPLSASVLS